MNKSKYSLFFNQEICGKMSSTMNLIWEVTCERKLILYQNSLNGTDAVTKCEHPKTPTPCAVPIVMTTKCVGYVDAMKSEATHPGLYNGCPYFPARQGQRFGQAAIDFQSLPTEENLSQSPTVMRWDGETRMMVIMMMSRDGKLWGFNTIKFRFLFSRLDSEFSKDPDLLQRNVSTQCPKINFWHLWIDFRIKEG